ncbi:MAG: NADH-quinone oxidoreductase subunit K [Deinococcus sp.]|nr:NADH-quinone oxidoreductase subunit K [Deinococcus sp.]
MKLLLAALAGVLFACGAYLVLRRSVLRVILGLGLISHAANLAIITAGAAEGGLPPLVGSLEPFTDPLPQALILTAIVISFGATALILALAAVAYRASGTEDPDQMASEEEQ